MLLDLWFQYISFVFKILAPIRSDINYGAPSSVCGTETPLEREDSSLAKDIKI